MMAFFKLFLFDHFVESFFQFVCYFLNDASTYFNLFNHHLVILHSSYLLLLSLAWMLAALPMQVLTLSL